MISLHFWAHLRTINRHRALVRKYCFRLGLYWQGLTHDLSKYAPVEFFAGVKYFQGITAQTTPSGRNMDTAPPGSTTRAATATTLSIGRITAPPARGS